MDVLAFIQMIDDEAVQERLAFLVARRKAPDGVVVNGERRELPAQIGLDSELLVGVPEVLVVREY